MAYRYSHMARRARIFTYGKKPKRGGRRRRSAVKKRTYRKSRAMSTKSILNKTSRKKRNGMLSFSNTNASGVISPLAQNPLTIVGSNSGNNIGLIHFRPTAMDLTSPGGGGNPIVDVAARTSSTCFMRGFAENIRIETSSGSPWFHRRICITTRDLLFLSLASGDTSGSERQSYASGFIETSAGFQRLAANVQLENSPTPQFANTISIWLSIMFKGKQGVDWDDFVTAPIDTTRVDLKFDKTWVYSSGNERGVLKEKKLWHPMNKNLYYADDENGAGMDTITASVTDKRGMGDYHIFDFFSQGSSGSTSDLLKIRFTSTLYWHEK